MSEWWLVALFSGLVLAFGFYLGYTVGEDIGWKRGYRWDKPRADVREENTND